MKRVILISIVLVLVLLGVSCTGEAVNNSGLVNAAVSANGMISKVATVNNATADTYYYTLECQTTSGKGESAFGEVTSETLIDDSFASTGSFNTGKISQGLWKLTVYGYKDEDLVVKGSSTANIDKNHNTFSLTLSPASATTGSVMVNDLRMNLLDAEASSVSFKVSVLNGSSVVATKTIAGVKPQNVDGVSFTDSLTGIASGSYLLKLELVRDSATVGVQVMAIDVVGGQTSVITGIVSPSEFVSPEVAILAAGNISGTLSVNNTSNFHLNNESLTCVWTPDDPTQTVAVTFYLDGYELGTINAINNGTYTWSGVIPEAFAAVGDFEVTAISTDGTSLSPAFGGRVRIIP